MMPSRNTRLPHMERHLRAFCARFLDGKTLARAHRGIYDFCWNSSLVDAAQIKNAVGMEYHAPIAAKDPAQSKIDAFVEQLSTLEGKCVFLLRGAFDALSRYENVTHVGIGVPANRAFICPDEREYLWLTELFYESLASVDCEDSFLEQYYGRMRRMFRTNQRLRERAVGLAGMVSYQCERRAVVLVDVGFQFTFSLFVAAALRCSKR